MASTQGKQARQANQRAFSFCFASLQVASVSTWSMTSMMDGSASCTSARRVISWHIVSCKLGFFAGSWVPFNAKGLSFKRADGTHAQLVGPGQCCFQPLHGNRWSTNASSPEEIRNDHSCDAAGLVGYITQVSQQHAMQCVAATCQCQCCA